MKRKQLAGILITGAVILVVGIVGIVSNIISKNILPESVSADREWEHCVLTAVFSEHLFQECFPLYCAQLSKQIYILHPDEYLISSVRRFQPVSDRNNT